MRQQPAPALPGHELTKPYTNTASVVDTELVTDVVVSEGRGVASDKFTRVFTSNPQIIPNGFNTSHMSGKTPTGGNILYQDGHAVWRRFAEMKVWLNWSNARYFWF